MSLVSDRNGVRIKADEKSKRRLMSEVVNYYWGGFTASNSKTDLLDLNINFIGEANNFLMYRLSNSATFFNMSLFKKLFASPMKLIFKSKRSVLLLDAVKPPQ